MLNGLFNTIASALNPGSVTQQRIEQPKSELAPSNITGASQEQVKKMSADPKANVVNEDKNSPDEADKLLEQGINLLQKIGLKISKEQITAALSKLGFITGKEVEAKVQTQVKAALTQAQQELTSVNKTTQSQTAPAVAKVDEQGNTVSINFENAKANLEEQQNQQAAANPIPSQTNQQIPTQLQQTG